MFLGLKKFCFIFVGTPFLLLVGCGNVHTGKYTSAYLKENSNINFKNKVLYIDDYYDLSTNKFLGKMYMEIQTLENGDSSIAYNLNGYEMGLFIRDSEQIAYSVIGDEKVKYKIEGDITKSTMYSDYLMLEDIMNIDFNDSYIELKEEESVSNNAALESSSNNLKSVDLVKVINDKGYYILYLDKETGVCKRLQVSFLNEDGSVKEMMNIILEDLEEEDYFYPRGIDEIEKVVELTGEEFVEQSKNFIYGSLITNSINNSVNDVLKDKAGWLEEENHEGHNH